MERCNDADRNVAGLALSMISELLTAGGDPGLLTNANLAQIAAAGWWTAGKTNDLSADKKNRNLNETNRLARTSANHIRRLM